jgi:hypothetical protein
MANNLSRTKEELVCSEYACDSKLLLSIGIEQKEKNIYANLLAWYSNPSFVVILGVAMTPALFSSTSNTSFFCAHSFL